MLARSRAAATMVGREWRTIRAGGDWAAQWQLKLTNLSRLVVAAQIGAAAAGAASVDDDLYRSGYPEKALAEVDPAGFGGWAEHPTSGAVLTIPALLYPAVITARATPGTATQKLAAGGRVAQTMAHWAVSEAGRNAAMVGATGRARTSLMFVDPAPMCQRCAVLVGKLFKPGTRSFTRHPGCDGRLVAVSDRDKPSVPPLDVSDIKDLTRDQLRAINDGANINQVINAKTAVRITRDGETKSVLRANGTRTMYGARGMERWTPKAIYAKAGDDQDMAIQLLRKHKYMR